MKTEKVEIKMLRRISKKTRLDVIRNDYIRRSFGVVNIAGKCRENRLRWQGQVERKNNW